MLPARVGDQQTGKLALDSKAFSLPFGTLSSHWQPRGTGASTESVPGFAPLMTIYVGNLSFQAEREDLLDLFGQYGEVRQCSLPLDRETGRKRGFAFVELADDAAEQKAIDDLQDVEWMGRMIRVNKATPREGGGGGGGGGRGGYGGGGGGNRGGGGGYGGGGGGGYGGGGGGGYGGGGGGNRW